MIYFSTLCRFSRIFHNNVSLTLKSLRRIVVKLSSNSSLSKFLINSRIYLQLFYSNIYIYIYIVSTNEIIQSDIYVISLLCFIIIILNIIILFHHYLRHTRRDKKTFFFLNIIIFRFVSLKITYVRHTVPYIIIYYRISTVTFVLSIPEHVTIRNAG